MATRSTVFKSFLNIANMDSNYYNEHNLTIAQHPSETNLRLMVRVVAFILNASEDLMFCKGIDEDNEPDLWEKDYGDDITLWIDLGQPDEKRIKKACSRAKKVIIYTYQDGMAESWYKNNEKVIKRFKNLSVIHLNINGDIEALAQRGMNLQCNITDDELTLISDDNSVIITKEGLFKIPCQSDKIISRIEHGRTI